MGKLAGLTGFAAIAGGLVSLAVGFAATGALAQDKGGEQSAWVKLCEKANIQVKGPDGKPANETKSICLTHHERLDGNTGMVIVSAAIRDLEGVPKKSLMVMVPLGMAIPPGVRAAVYTADQWQKAQKNEKIDEKALKPMKLPFTLCHPAGCTAEIEAPDDLIDSLKKGGGLMVLAVNSAGQPIGFPVPLTGFTAAHDGQPVDNKLYATERGKLMAQIRERQRSLIEEAKKKQAEAQGAKPAAEKKK